MSAQKINDKCSVCGRRDAKPCERCGSAFYCSPECREKEEVVHQVLCESFKQEKCPEGRYLRAILFPAESPTPKLVWALVYENEDGMCFTVDSEPEEVKRLLGMTATRVWYDCRLIGRGSIHRPKKGHMLVFYIGQQGLADALPAMNKSVNTILPFENKGFRGSVLAIGRFGERETGTASYQPEDHDLDMDNFVVVAEYLETNLKRERSWESS